MRFPLLLPLVALAAAACVRTAPPEGAREADPVSRPPIEEVVSRHAPELMAIPGVNLVFVGEEDGAPCIRVGFESLPSSERDRVPEEIEGWPVVVDESGEIRPLDAGD